MMFTDVPLPAPFAPSSATLSNVTASVVTPRDAVAPTQPRILPRISVRP